MAFLLFFSHLKVVVLSVEEGKMSSQREIDEHFENFITATFKPEVFKLIFYR